MCDLEVFEDVKNPDRFAGFAVVYLVVNMTDSSWTFDSRRQIL